MIQYFIMKASPLLSPPLYFKPIMILWPLQHFHSLYTYVRPLQHSHTASNGTLKTSDIFMASVDSLTFGPLLCSHGLYMTCSGHSLAYTPIPRPLMAFPLSALSRPTKLKYFRFGAIKSLHRFKIMVLKRRVLKRHNRFIAS